MSTNISFCLISSPNMFRREILYYTFYTICDAIQVIFTSNYSTITFLMMYGAMWSLNIRFDARFFAVASCILGFMKVFTIDFFSNAIRDFSNYLVARKRIEVCIRKIKTDVPMKFTPFRHFCSLTSANGTVDCCPFQIQKILHQMS